MPLIGLGLVDTIEDVEEMVLAVDEDGSGNIEFPEFLDIVKNKNGNEKTKVITEFFQALTNGSFSEKDIAFPNYVLELMGLNFYYCDGLQPKMRGGVINEHECNSGIYK